MQLHLSDHDAQLLRRVLDSYLTELRGEIVDTDNPGFRRGLRSERDTLTAIKERLDADATEVPVVARMVRMTAVLTEYD